MTSPQLTPSDQPAIAFLTKWKRSIEVSVSPEILRAQWDSKRNQDEIGAIKFPAGVLEEMAGLVEARVGQLSRVFNHAQGEA